MQTTKKKKPLAGWESDILEKVGSKYKAKKWKYCKSPKPYVRIPPAASQMVCVLLFNLKSCETTTTWPNSRKQHQSSSIVALLHHLAWCVFHLRVKPCNNCDMTEQREALSVTFCNEPQKRKSNAIKWVINTEPWIQESNCSWPPALV